jgi:hypothetical protein
MRKGPKDFFSPRPFILTGVRTLLSVDASLPPKERAYMQEMLAYMHIFMHVLSKSPPFREKSLPGFSTTYLLRNNCGRH